MYDKTIQYLIPIIFTILIVGITLEATSDQQYLKQLFYFDSEKTFFSTIACRMKYMLHTSTIGILHFKKKKNRSGKGKPTRDFPILHAFIILLRNHPVGK